MPDVIHVFLMAGFLFLCLRLGKFLEKVAK